MLDCLEHWMSCSCGPSTMMAYHRIGSTEERNECSSFISWFSTSAPLPTGLSAKLKICVICWGEGNWIKTQKSQPYVVLFRQLAWKSLSWRLTMGNSSSSSSSSICFSPSLPVCDFSASHLLSCSWINRGALMSSTVITKIIPTRNNLEYRQT